MAHTCNPIHRTLRQKDFEFEASLGYNGELQVNLGYIMRPFQTSTSSKKENKPGLGYSLVIKHAQGSGFNPQYYSLKVKEPPDCTLKHLHHTVMLLSPLHR